MLPECLGQPNSITTSNTRVRTRDLSLNTQHSNHENLTEVKLRLKEKNQYNPKTGGGGQKPSNRRRPVAKQPVGTNGIQSNRGTKGGGGPSGPRAARGSAKQRDRWRAGRRPASPEGGGGKAGRKPLSVRTVGGKPWERGARSAGRVRRHTSARRGERRRALQGS